MKLDELRRELDTDAQRRCEAQEKTIKELLHEIKYFKEMLKDREEDIQQLMNRCWVQTRGVICIFCDFSKKCNARQKNK